jgi:predicted phosphoadenosine phosphosulfate sulfurtransferase
MTLRQKIKKYVDTWKERGYPKDIPDEVPEELMKLGKAPSYKAIALAILKNDFHLTTLGFTPPVSKYYSILKKIEIQERDKNLPPRKKRL